MIVVTGALTARTETLAALMARCIAHSAHSRGEPGCVSHNVYADCENEMRLFFHEVWSDRPALLAHFQHPQSHAFMREAHALAVESAGPTICEAKEIAL